MTVQTFKLNYDAQIKWGVCDRFEHVEQIEDEGTGFGFSRVPRFGEATSWQGVILVADGHGTGPDSTLDSASNSKGGSREQGRYLTGPPSFSDLADFIPVVQNELLGPTVLPAHGHAGLSFNIPGPQPCVKSERTKPTHVNAAPGCQGMCLPRGRLLIPPVASPLAARPPRLHRPLNTLLPPSCSHHISL